MTRGPKAELIEKVRCKHVGKWIGLKGTSVVAVSDTHDAIYKRLKEKGIDGVYVFYSPTEKEREYGFLFWVCKCGSRKES